MSDDEWRPTRAPATPRDDVLPPALADAVAGLAPPPPATDAQVAAVLGRVRGRPVPRRARPARPFARGVWGAAAAAAVAAVALGVARWRDARPAGPVAAAAGPAAVASPVGYDVHFRFGAGAARGGPRTVAVAGDFNGWKAGATALRRDPATGAWSARVRLSEGRYVYAFVVDGREWLPDPLAPLAPPDGFGRQSSVLVVAPRFASAD